MATLEGFVCCGIKALNDITGYKPETILSEICQEWFDDTPRAFLVFSQARANKREKIISGPNLVHYIKEHRLGLVYKMRPKLNQNTRNRLWVWIWAVNNPRLKSLALKNGWYEKKEGW